jgi:hypothetical protein
MASAIINSFNVGTDASLTITNNSNGGLVVLDGKKTSFNAKSEDKVIKSSPIDNGGIPDHRVIADGWTGTIEVDRANADFGSLYSVLEQNYYAGAPQAYFVITVTVQRPDGSGVDRTQFLNAVFHGYDPGTFTKDNKVSSRVSFSAAQCVEV